MNLTGKLVLSDSCWGWVTGKESNYDIQIYWIGWANIDNKKRYVAGHGWTPRGMAETFYQNYLDYLKTLE